MAEEAEQPRREAGPGPVSTRKPPADAPQSPPLRAWAAGLGPIRKQPSGSGNSRQDPEAVSAVTRECGNPPLALRRWLQLRRRPRSRTGGCGDREPVCEGASVHAGSCVSGGGASSAARRWGMDRGDWERGRGHASEKGGGAWNNRGRGGAQWFKRWGPMESYVWAWL